MRAGSVYCWCEGISRLTLRVRVCVRALAPLADSYLATSLRNHVAQPCGSVREQPGVGKILKVAAEVNEMQAMKRHTWLISSSMVRCTSLSPPAPSSKRAPPTASISSKKMTQAFFVLAISKSSRIIRAPLILGGKNCTHVSKYMGRISTTEAAASILEVLGVPMLWAAAEIIRMAGQSTRVRIATSSAQLTSPTYFWTSSEPMTRIKQASVRFATARALSVFPVPGGP